MTTPQGASMPLIVGIYGPPGSGKTSELVRTWPEGLFYANKADLRSALNVCGYMPLDSHIRHGAWNLQTLIDSLKVEFPGNKNPKGYPAILLDEFNSMLLRFYATLPNKDDRQKYKVLNDRLMAFFDQLRLLNDAGVTIAWSAHLQRADWSKTTEGQKIAMEKEGGPDTPGKTMETLAKRSDELLRLDIDPARQGEHQWAYFAGRFGSGNTYHSKTRLGIVDATGTAPNLAEILRASGFDTKRPKQYHDWMERVVTHYTAQASAAGNATIAVQSLVQDLKSMVASNEIPVGILQWCAQDVLARFEIQQRTSLEKRFAKLGIFV